MMVVTYSVSVKMKQWDIIDVIKGKCWELNAN